MLNRSIQTTPLAIPRSRRSEEWRGLTSGKAGEYIPLAFFHLLREDQLRGQVMVQVKMAEALHTIVNPIRVTVQAHLVAKIALARFEGSRETLDRAYKGQTMPGGGITPAWHILDSGIASQGDDDWGHAIYDKLGVHYVSTTRIPSDIVESYWTVHNWRRAALSKALPQVAITGNGLAPAFWDDPKFMHIKPSFDAAMMEGVVPVGIAGVVDVGGAGNWGTNIGGTAAASSIRQTSASSPFIIQNPGNTGGYQLAPILKVDLSGVSGATISLANIELAKKAQTFAKMRERYQGIPDEYLIDLLMSGIRVPPEEFREPILIGQASTVIGQTERYATNYEDLDKSLTNGVAQLAMSINTPAIETGGLVLVTCEVVPEQLYERVQDVSLTMDATGSAAWLPDAMDDLLDPQKVEVVTNDYADTFATAPSGVFGYAPLNHRWQKSIARVGGKFKRPVPDAFKEERQRIWSVEKNDPKLSADFYLCPQPFPHTVFADATADPFEFIVVGNASILGLTQFGEGFEEDGDHYDKIIADVDSGRIVPTPPVLLDSEEEADGEAVNEEEATTNEEA